MALSQEIIDTARSTQGPEGEDLVDPSDFCRRCRGSGVQSFPTERGTTLTEPCDLCRGSGYRTVKVTA